MRPLPIAASLVCALLLSMPADAGSTINPSVPAQNSPLVSAPVRGNFLAAYNDVNNILGMFASSTAPTSPTQGQDWLNTTSVTAATWNKWDASTATWVTIGTFNLTAGTFTIAGSLTISVGSGVGLTTSGCSPLGLGGTCTIGATSNTVRLTGIGLGGAAPATGLEVYNAAVSTTGNGQGVFGASTTAGGTLGGQGSTSDLTLLNSSGATVCSVATGTQTLNCNTASLTNPLGVASGGTGLASGTSGGILGFTGSTTLASSGLLAANGVLIGGGAGATPSAITACTNGQLVVGVTSAPPACQTMSGDISSITSGGAVILGKVNGVSYGSSPSTNTVPVVTGPNATTYETVPNGALANSSLTVAVGSSVGISLSGCGPVSLGSTCTISTTNDTVQWTALGLGGAVPATGLRVYNAVVAPSANGQLAFGASVTGGGVIEGQGSTSDLTLNNKGGSTVCSVATGTTTINCATLTLANQLTVGNGGTGLTSGTSGGVPYFSSSSAMQSSAALAADGFVIGGGAATAPSTITACTNGQLPVGATSAPPACQTMGGDVSTITSGGLVTLGKLDGVTYPASPSANTVPVVTSASGGGTVTYETAPIAAGGTGQTTANAARQSSGLDVLGDQGTAHGDGNAVIGNAERLAYTNATLTAARTWTLPAAAVTGQPYTILIADMAGGATSSNTITAQRAGSDTVNGSTTVVVINSAYGKAACSSDGSSKWDCQQLAGGGSSGTVTQVNCGGVAITTTGTCPEPFTYKNCSLAASVTSNLLTVAVKDNTGADPTSTSPCRIAFRNATATTGSWVLDSVTSALSISTNATGATLGSASNKAFRFWVVAFDNSGTVVLSLFNATSSTQCFPINEGLVQSSTAISGSATSSGTYYTPNGTTLTSKAIRVLGYVEYNSTGLTTAGTYASGPNFIQSFSPSMRLPCEPLGRLNAVANVTADTGTNSASFSEPSTTVRQAYTPVSAADPVLVSLSINAYTNAASVLGSGNVFRGTTAGTNPLCSEQINDTPYTGGILIPFNFVECFDYPNTTSSQTYSYQRRSILAGASMISPYNYTTSFNNVQWTIQEIQG